MCGGFVGGGDGVGGEVVIFGMGDDCDVEVVGIGKDVMYYVVVVDLVFVGVDCVCVC